MRTISKLALVSTMALVGGAAVSAAPVSGGLIDTDGSETFEYTGAPEDFEVPADVCALTIEAWGAAGGGASAYASSDAGIVEPLEEIPLPDPAKGGYAKATVTVTPGETLQVNVGGVGGDGAVATNGNASVLSTFDAGAGGWPDGGDGSADGVIRFEPGITYVSSFPAAYAESVAAAGGGGGSSDVRRGGTGLANRVVVAGGGGGLGAAGIAWGFAIDESDVGAGAVSLPYSATDAQTGLAAAGDGGGATGGDGDSVELESGQGVIFVPVGAAAAGVGAQGDGGDGAPGAGGNGSAEASDAGDNGTSDFFGVDYATAATAAAAGGGGGGGYFGGGGGGSLADTLIAVPVEDTSTAEDPDVGAAAFAGAGGGGGGSGFGPVGTEYESGVNEGDGTVVLSWTVDPGCGAVSPADAIVTPIRFTG